MAMYTDMGSCRLFYPRRVVVESQEQKHTVGTKWTPFVAKVSGMHHVKLQLGLYACCVCACRFYQ